MLFCSVPTVAVVGIIITMTAKFTNGVGKTDVTMPGARKSINAAFLQKLWALWPEFELGLVPYDYFVQHIYVLKHFVHV